jgi:hypothetical protein
MTEVGLAIDSLIDKVNNFRYVPQEMPLSQWPLPLLLSFGYLAGVFILQTYMKDRKAYTLVNFTIIHNFIMTFGSLIMFTGMATSLFAIWQVPHPIHFFPPFGQDFFDRRNEIS